MRARVQKDSWYTKSILSIALTDLRSIELSHHDLQSNYHDMKEWKRRLGTPQFFRKKPIWWNVARSNSLQSRQIWILSSTKLKWAILPHYQCLLSRVWYRILKGWTVLPRRHLWESSRSSLFLEMVLPAHHFHCDSASECYLTVIKIGKLYATDSPKRQEHTWSKCWGWKYFMFTSSTQTAKVIGAVTTINIVGWCVTSPFSPASFYQKTELSSIFY